MALKLDLLQSVPKSEARSHILMAISSRMRDINSLCYPGDHEGIVRKRQTAEYISPMYRMD